MSENVEILNNSTEMEKVEIDKQLRTVDKDINEEDVVKPKEESTHKYNLSKFALKQILCNNVRNKTITLLGSFPDVSNDDKAIIVFEKEAFLEHEVQTPNANETEGANDTGDSEVLDDAANKTDTSLNSSILNKSYFNDELEVQTEFINNIYGNFRCIPSEKLNSIKTTVIYPATDKHIDKYNIRQKFIISESPILYENITLPFIKAHPLSLEWVYNILEHKQEAERIVYEDPHPDNGFIIIPDLKWSGKNLENMYYLVIVNKRGIKSLRDLTAKHLPLLRNIRNKAADTMNKISGLKMIQLRMYLHYQPSFYHLHVHINPIRNEAPGIACEKSHLLDTVINNIELMPNYYQLATLQFVAFEGSQLTDRYIDVNAMRKRRRTSNEDDENPAKKMRTRRRSY